MDITDQKQQYQALQAARTELVESAVAEIASHLEGLDADICKEILSKVHQKLTVTVIVGEDSGMVSEASINSARNLWK